MFSNNLIAGVSGQGGAYSIEDSLRFNDNDSAYLSRTPSVAGNRKTWTWSGWVKRGNVGISAYLLDADIGGSAATLIRFVDNDKLRLYTYDGSSSQYFDTTALFRDVSGWYHIVGVHDTTQSGADKLKLYVNGIRQAGSTTGSVADNSDGYVNSTIQHNLGRFIYVDGEYLDGYMAEVNFIDGQALTADDFGQIDATTGEWSPKAYSGTYGTNGFYLPFNGNANDDSGNGNNWTENNLASTDYMIDTPTNNFSVLNPLDKDAAIILSEGNLKTFLSGSSGNVIAYGTVGVSTGKWYMETALNNFSYPGNGAAGIFGMHNGSNRVGATYSSGSTSWYAYSEGAFTALSFNGSAIGMVMQIAIDLDAGKLWVGKDGVWNGSGDPDTGANPDRTFTPSGTYKMSAEPYRDGVGYWLLTVNAGADSSFAGLKTRQGNTDANGIGDFYYTPPTGYLALCTDNLPAPAIEQPETQFNVVTYTGNGGTLDVDVGFQPDLVWIKVRSGLGNHSLYDSVRGVTKRLSSSLTNTESTFANSLTSFNADGFSLGSNPDGDVNASGSTYVAWCWKAGGTAVTNTDGSITSQVSANVDAGFSIVTWNGGGAGYSVGHGLETAPSLYIIKNRNAAYNWAVFTTSIDGSLDFLYLNTTAAKTNSGGSLPTSTIVYPGQSEVSNYVMYCFHSVEGFSKIGTYVGNGSADGPFIYTGFKPAFVMFKRTDSTGSWLIYDNARQGYNLENDYIYVNSANAEANGGSNGIDFLSNGIKLRNTYNDANTSGATYIYMAFAEAPFKNALAR